ncbi:MAG: hypothetical protein K2Y39_19075 [Candidatus Obscuribacterales bacterium]|nr:hypothetical protein [Candidatus Obscuribacterales bacterium]
MTEKAKKPAKETPVYSLVRASRCYNCDAKQEPGSIVKFEPGKDEREIRCRKCASLEEMEFLRSGNAKVTQMAKKYSQRVVLVMQWSELWKTYERIGLLVESQAIDRIEKELKIRFENRETKQIH